MKIDGIDLDNLSEEEQEIWSKKFLSESWRIYQIKAHRGMKNQKGVTLEEMKAQVLRLFKYNLDKLTLEEQVIWDIATLSEEERMSAIQEIRNTKKRAEFLLRKHQREEMPKPKHR